MYTNFNYGKKTTFFFSRRARGSHGLLLNGDEVAHTSPYLVTKGSPRFAKVAFTLAEVLITLGVIGVVAAMTLPTLIQNYKKHVVETRLARFYTVINEAVKISETVNGDKKYWDSLEGGYETNEEGELDYSKPQALAWFEKYLKPYIKYTKYDIINSDDTYGRVAVYFEDGSLLTFNKHIWKFIPTAQNSKLVEDEDGRKNIDFEAVKAYSFLFEPTESRPEFEYHYNKGVEPYAWAWDGKRESLIANCTKNSTAYCAKLIQLNGWKIPKDYPLKF